MKNISLIYKKRFTSEENKKKNMFWKCFIKYFLQKRIKKNSSILELGSGNGEFINNIKCKTKYVLEKNSESLKNLNKDINRINDDILNIKTLSDNSIDYIFASNFFEHLESKEQVIQCFKELKRVLRKKGEIFLIQPNFKWCYREYWDYIDHRLAFTHKSMIELFNMFDFKILEIYDKFLPYTVKSKLPVNSKLIKLYLKIPFLWKIFGKQMFIRGRKA